MKVCSSCQRTYADDLNFCPHDSMPLSETDDALPAGQVLDGRYEIEALVAATPNGTVYRVLDIQRGCRVALKTFGSELWRETDGGLRYFQLKLRDVFRFDHPNAVRIDDITDNYMVMEWVEGQRLDEAMRERGRFTPREALELLEPIARVLDAARVRRIECEFLTPADVMLKRAEDNSTFVKLLPSIFNRRFAGRDIDERSNTPDLKPEAALVSPYVAPELLAGAASPEDDGRAQVYSLGVIAYELIFGRKPFDATAADERAPGETTAQPGLLTEHAPDVLRVIAYALSGRLKDRPPTAGKFLSELQFALRIKEILTERSPYELLGMVSGVIGDNASISRSSGDIQTESAGSSRRPDADASPSTSAEEAADEPLHLDENVQFTVYQPERIAPARWYALLAFAHLSKRRADAPPDEPEPLAEVKRIAERVLADEPAEYDALKQNSLHAVPRAGEITFVPEMAGCEFNPPRQSFSWQKSVHKVEFEMRAAQTLEGSTARGRLTVFLGSLILADVPLVVRVEGGAASVSSQGESQPAVPKSAAPYRKIFPSYSHKDRALVEQIEQHVHALGDKYLRDVTELRAGQDWQRWMRDAIREADVFQLFWSHNSMRSHYVREEWEYALSLGRPNFVRPTYWEFPLPESPNENLPPDELRRLHFQYLQSSTVTQHPAQAVSEAPAAAEDEDEAPAPEEWQERAAPVEAAAATPVGREVSCRVCGSRHSNAHTFCLNCGSRLDVRAQSPVQPGAATAAPQRDDAFDVFRQQREQQQLESAPEQASASPYQSMPMPMSTPPAPAAAPQGRTAVWFALVGCLLFLVVLAFGLYLLSYLF